MVRRVLFFGFLSVGLMLSVSLYREAEANRLQSATNEICSQIPAFLEARDYTLTTWPTAASMDAAAGLTYFSAMVEADHSWCTSPSPADSAGLVDRTLRWHFGNASEALRQYQITAQSVPTTAAPAPATPAPSSDVTGEQLAVLQQRLTALEARVKTAEAQLAGLTKRQIENIAVAAIISRCYTKIIEGGMIGDVYLRTGEVLSVRLICR